MNNFGKAILIDSIKHQEIGGKEIALEKEFNLEELLTTDFKEMNVALYNFIIRRMDLTDKTTEEAEKIKCYYGHVGLFGYYICEDEIKERI